MAMPVGQRQNQLSYIQRLYTPRNSYYEDDPYWIQQDESRQFLQYLRGRLDPSLPLVGDYRGADQLKRIQKPL
jgi:hypothetical protein